MDKKISTKAAIITVIVSVICFIGIYGILFVFPIGFGGSNDLVLQDSSSKTVQPKPEAVIVKKAKPGELVEGFPKELIVSTDAKIRGSAENLSKSSNTQFLVSSYETSENISKIEEYYLDYFEKNGWQVVNKKQINQNLLLTAFSTTTGLVNINSFVKADSNVIIIAFNKIAK